MALSAGRRTDKRDSEFYSFPVLAAAHIYAGSLVVLDSSGWAKPATNATGLICVGRAEADVDNTSGASGDLSVQVRAGAFKWANGDSIAKDSIGDTMYAYDDQTVKKTASGLSPAGICVAVDTDGVWVFTSPASLLASTGLLAANNLSDVGSQATAQTNLGLGTTDTPTFAKVFRLHPIATKTTAYTVAKGTDDDGYLQTATDNEVVTLPDIAASNKGMVVTIQNIGADGAAKVSVSPDSTDKIKGQIDSIEFGGVANKDAINTKATAKQGDFITLVSDGTDTWWVVGGQGVWASEP